jgi:hypothetical protein
LVAHAGEEEIDVGYGLTAVDVNEEDELRKLILNVHKLDTADQKKDLPRINSK